MLHKLLPNRFVLTNFPPLYIHDDVLSYTLNVIVIGYKFVDVQFIFFMLFCCFINVCYKRSCAFIYNTLSHTHSPHSRYFFCNFWYYCLLFCVYRECNLRMCILLLLVLFYYVITDLFVFFLLCVCPNLVPRRTK